MKDLELMDKLMDTEYFLDGVVLKKDGFDLTFRHTTISSAKIETVLNLIEGRDYEIYGIYDWVHIIVKRNKT